MTFALAYSSIVRYVSRGLISHYAKADVRKRLLAASIDGLLVVTLCLVCWIGRAPLYLALGAGYLLLRDAIGGQSIGKILLGLVVIDLTTGRAASVSGSIEAESSTASSWSEHRRDLSRSAHDHVRSSGPAAGRQAGAHASGRRRWSQRPGEVVSRLASEPGRWARRCHGQATTPRSRTNRSSSVIR